MAVEMKVTGSLPEEKLYIGKCMRCNSEYEAKQGDLKYESDYRDSYYSQKCLLTGCNNTVNFSIKR